MSAYRGLEETPPPPPPHQNIEPSKTAPPMTNHDQDEPNLLLLPPIPPHKDHLAHHSSIASGMDIDRKRLVESISDHLYGRGNLWTRDDDFSVAQPQSQCAGCRRTRSDHEATEGLCSGWQFNSNSTELIGQKIV